MIKEPSSATENTQDLKDKSDAQDQQLKAKILPFKQSSRMSGDTASSSLVTGRPGSARTAGKRFSTLGRKI